jgi:hypothetical protein
LNGILGSLGGQHSGNCPSATKKKNAQIKDFFLVSTEQNKNCYEQTTNKKKCAQKNPLMVKANQHGYNFEF